MHPCSNQFERGLTGTFQQDTLDSAGRCPADRIVSQFIEIEISQSITDLCCNQHRAVADSSMDSR